MGIVVSLPCVPIDDDCDDFCNREVRILSDEEYEKYFNRDQVETGIISDDEESEDETTDELFEEMNNSRREIKGSDDKKQIKIEF